MAGIGFRLRELLDQGTLTGWFRAYFSGTVIALGPFLLSVICLATLTTHRFSVLDADSQQGFTASIVYVFAGSLMFTGLYQVVLTRYLADKIYRGEYSEILESLFPFFLLTVAVCALTGIPVLVRVELSFVSRVLLFSLYVSLACLFVSMAFVTTAHRYRSAVFAFGIAAGIGILLGYMGGRHFGLNGLVAGYTIGHVAAVGFIVEWLTSEFGFPKKWDWGGVRYLKQFPVLAGIGLLQILGCWVDNFVIWTSELAVVSHGLVTAPKYDNAMFLGFLTALPTIVHFFVKLEAEVSIDFQRYYDEVFFKSSLDAIERAADNLRKQVLRAVMSILKVQALVTFLFAFFSEDILRAIGVPLSQIGMFRASVVGSCFLVFMLFSNVLLLYLDRQRDVFVSVLIFAGANLAFTYGTLNWGYRMYGFGFAGACLLGMIVSLHRLALRLENLEFITFFGIRIQGQIQGSRRLLARRGGNKYGTYQPLSLQPDEAA